MYEIKEKGYFSRKKNSLNNTCRPKWPWFQLGSHPCSSSRK